MTIPALHNLYVALTGLEIRLDMHREREWHEWTKRGFTEIDLRQVILHLKQGIFKNKRNIGCLKFRNLIGMPDYFEEDLAESKALARGKHIVTQKEKVLKAAQRDDPKKPMGATARSAADILSTMEAQAFFALRGRL